MTLAAYSGPSTVSTPNTVIDGKTIGCITVAATGVVVRNSRISCSSGYAVFVRDNGSGSLLIEDSEITCNNSNATGLGEANITARRIDVSGCENGFDVNQNVTVEDSYIHDLFMGNSAHADGMQFSEAANNVTIRHNTIFGMGSNGALGTSALIMDLPGHSNFLIENNLFGGGAYTVYCVDPG